MGIHLDNFSDTGMAGGGGGSTFSEMGTGTQVLVGFRVFTGKWVDKIVPIFSEIAVPGWGGRDFPSPGFGGQGGNPQDILPPGNDYAVVQLSIRSDWYVDGGSVTWRKFVGGVPGADFQTMTFGGTGGRWTSALQLQDGWIAVGIYGRAGAFLDAIGLKGARPVVS